MADVDAWLTAVLIGGEDRETEEQWLTSVKTQIKQKLLESYRNGQKAGPATNRRFQPYGKLRQK